MSRGYPDFFGYSIFPNYGTTYRTLANDSLIMVDETQEEWNISGKGVILGGWMAIGNITDINKCILTVKIDGQTNQFRSMYWMDWYNIITPNSGIMYLTKLDEDNKDVILSFSVGVPFGNNFLVTVKNSTDADAYTATGNLIYTKMLGI